MNNIEMVASPLTPSPRLCGARAGVRGISVFLER